MKISVVIVNYNVRYFLEQCLKSLQAALQGIEAEVFVVDNHSKDQSLKMLKEKFPSVHLIANQENVGFSKANNQAIKKASGEYILLLNPDTVVGEDSITSVLEFMDQTADCGALGVKMIDGSGKFLPESKRGLPRPMTAFYKMTGLSSLFPKSKVFNQYHLGFLDKDEIHSVEVLSGACMFFKKAVLDKIGLLDEDFFMYGEDIDISYRVNLAGFKNYYYPKTQIIHYKGESTKKGSMNYVRIFYKAMIIFAKKHFSKGKASLYVMAIQLAIFLKAILSFTKRLFSQAFLFLLDAVLIFTSLQFIKKFWGQYRFNNPDYYEGSNLYVLLPILLVVWLISIFFGTGYDKNVKPKKLFRSIALGTILMLAVYGLLPDTFRSSRAIILIGAGATIGISLVLRFLQSLLQNGSLFSAQEKNVLIIGSEAESKRAIELLQLAKINFNYAGTLHDGENDSEYINGRVENLEEFIHVKSVNEIIFCSSDISNQEISRWMSTLGPNLKYKILPQNSLGIIGSSSKNTSGELYTIDVRYNIHDPAHKRNKRLLDLIFSFFALLFSPILYIFSKDRSQYFQNCFKVLLGEKSWVGYANWDENVSDLPDIKKGILSPQSLDDKYDEKVHHQINLIYARDYSIWKDVEIFWKNIRYLGLKKKK